VTERFSFYSLRQHPLFLPNPLLDAFSRRYVVSADAKTATIGESETSAALRPVRWPMANKALIASTANRRATPSASFQTPFRA